jgi:hypothetical protein
MVLSQKYGIPTSEMVLQGSYSLFSPAALARGNVAVSFGTLLSAKGSLVGASDFKTMHLTNKKLSSSNRGAKHGLLKAD